MKVLLYDGKVFLTAKAFYDYIENTKDKPESWESGYVSVAFSYKLSTVSGLKVDWVTANKKEIVSLESKDEGWMIWDKGLDMSFEEYVRETEEPFTKEDLWRMAVDYVTKYDIPRSRLKRMVDDIISVSTDVGKKRGVYLYKLTNDKEKAHG